MTPVRLRDTQPGSKRDGEKKEAIHDETFLHR